MTRGHHTYVALDSRSVLSIEHKKRVDREAQEPRKSEEKGSEFRIFARICVPDGIRVLSLMEPDAGPRVSEHAYTRCGSRGDTHLASMPSRYSRSSL